jgi:hypothetical protein
MTGLNPYKEDVYEIPGERDSSLGTVTSVTATAPVASTGGTDPVISIPAATNASDGHATAAQILALEAATAAQHARQHALDATADHTIGSLTNTYLVKSDGSKLVPATNTDAQVSAAVTASHSNATDHTRSHTITSTSDHTSSATSGKMLKADASGLPIDATNTDAEVSSAVSLKHAAVTLDVNADTFLSLSTQVLGLDNQAANLALMGPVSGAAAVPTFRSPQAKDVTIPGGIGTPTYDDMQDFLRMTRSSGRITGGTISAYVAPPTADGKVVISAMEGMIFTTNVLGGDYIYFKQAAGTVDLTGLADNMVYWIYFDWNGGTPRYMATATRSDIHQYDQFSVGRVWRSGNTVEPIFTGHNLFNKDRRSHERLILKYGNMDRVSGATLSQHLTALRIQVDAGSWYVANYAYTTPLANTFFVWYKHEAGAWTRTSALTLFSDTIVSTHTVYTTYQNDTDLTAIGGSNYGVYWVFLCPDGHLNVVLGTSTYSNIGAAQAATVPESLPPYCVDWAKLIGRVICRTGAAAFHSVESSFTTQFTLSAATDHSSLANLSADDHTQYLLVTNIDDSPVDGELAQPISSNWAYDESNVFKNLQTTASNQSIGSGYNGHVLGPWTVGNGYTFTIANGSRFMVLND